MADNVANMKIYRGLASIPAGSLKNACVTVGNFDGVHRGHRALLGQTRDLANRYAGDACALTFWPHPRSIVSSNVPPLISTLPQREAWIAETGIDALIVQPFDLDFAATSPEDFLRLLKASLAPRHLILGHDFKFGKGGRGTAELAKTMADDLGFEVTEFEQVYLNESVVSSSHVREALLAGDVRKAHDYLGRPWQVWGHSQPGAGRGRTLGFPTVNFATENDLLVPDGVYGGRLHLADGSQWVAAISVGTNPTFGTEPRHLEAFILDCESPNVAGELRLDVISYVRTQVTYGHAAKLIEQIAADVDVIREQALRERWLPSVANSAV